MSKRPRKLPRRGSQLELTARTWGGRRAGAGRKPGKRRAVPHRRRAPLSRHHPVHVTLRVREGVPSLRRAALMKEIRDSIRKSHKPGFRVVQYSVLSTHLHLVVEANDRRVLGRAIGGLKIRLARRLNKLLGLRGKLFSHRYHARPLTTPRETRIGLLYVLNNARKHAAERGRRLAAGWIDPCSSGATFDGWIRRPGRIQRAGSSPHDVTAAPRTWLLRVGWRRGGLLDPNAIPGAG